MRGSADALLRAVRKLAEHALHHAPPGTEVEIGVEGGPHPGPAILVEDRGPGIAAADREADLRPALQKRRDPASGAGLGLAFVVGTARAHAARVTLETPLAGGTRIGLHFGAPG